MADPTQSADITVRMSKLPLLLLMTAATIAAETCVVGSKERDRYNRVSRELGKAIDNG